jgi:hypothetical protein
MKNGINITSIIAGSTLLGTISYFLIKPKKKVKKNVPKKIMTDDEASNSYFI